MVNLNGTEEASHMSKKQATPATDAALKTALNVLAKYLPCEASAVPKHIRRFLRLLEIKHWLYAECTGPSVYVWKVTARGSQHVQEQSK